MMPEPGCGIRRPETRSIPKWADRMETVYELGDEPCALPFSVPLSYGILSQGTVAAGLQSRGSYSCRNCGLATRPPARRATSVMRGALGQEIGDALRYYHRCGVGVRTDTVRHYRGIGYEESI